MKRIIRDFSPAWFSVSMGTGVVSILLHQLPYNGTWIYWLSVMLFVLNLILFVTAMSFSILRYAIYPEAWKAMLKHPVQVITLAMMPMAFATLVNMTVYVCVPLWGHWMISTSWIMWWADVVVSEAICLFLAFEIFWTYKTDPSNMTTASLFSVLPAIVVASSGGIIANVLPDAEHAKLTIIVSYVLWGAGVPPAMAILIVYFHRIFGHTLRAKDQTASLFLPLGPFGLGAFGLIQLGKASVNVPLLNELYDLQVGRILYGGGLYTSLIIWGSGLLWLFLATSSMIRSGAKFEMEWWGVTFPGGVFGLATILLGQELKSSFFDIFGMIISICVIIFWCGVVLGTIRKIFTKEIYSTSYMAEILSEGHISTLSIQTV